MKQIKFFLMLLLLMSTMAYPSSELILYNGETVKFSNSASWDTNGSTLVQATASPYSKPYHLQATLRNLNWWGGAAYVFKNWGLLDLSKATSLSMAVKSNQAKKVSVSLYDANKKVSKYISVALTSKYKVVSIPISNFSDVDLTKIQAVVFSVSVSGTHTYKINIDDIKAAISDTPTPTPVPTPTPSPTPSPTPTPPPTPSPTPTPVPKSSIDFGVDGILQIHTIGDSITDNPRWRAEIYNGLTRDGFKTDFIGTLTDPYPQTIESQHDGHSGYTTGGIINEIAAWFTKILKPELTIVMIGTNDVAWWIAEPTSAVVVRLGTILDKVRINSPKGMILVSTIPPESSQIIDLNKWDRATLAVEYNKGVVDLVAKRKATGEPIDLVDSFSVLTLSDLYDGIHPSESGNIKIGQLFLSKIKPLIPTPTPSPTPIPTPTPTPSPTPTDNEAVRVKAASFVKGLTGKNNLLVGSGNFYNTALGLKPAIHYQYLVSGWRSWNSPDGEYATVVLNQAKTLSAIPMFSYYQLAYEFEVKNYGILTSSALHQYLLDLRLLFQKIAAYNGYVLVQLEADFWGYLQQYAVTLNTPAANIAAKINYSDLPECTTLPENVGGLFSCIIKMGKTIAPKVKFGFHASGWGDWYNPVDPKAPVVEKATSVANFLRSVGSDQTDFVTIDTCDRDAGFWEAQGSKNIYWDETNQTLPNYTNYFTWVKTLTKVMNTPVLLWQTPFGVPSTTPGGTDGHYRDNRVRYLFSHMSEVAAAGGLGVVFGAGAAKQTTPDTDGGQFKTALDKYLTTPVDLLKR